MAFENTISHGEYGPDYSLTPIIPGDNERWELRLDIGRQSLPVETRIFNGRTLQCRILATPSQDASEWFPTAVRIECYRDGAVWWVQEYSDIKTSRGSPAEPLRVVVEPGAIVNDFRLGAPVCYTLGPRPPTDEELAAMRTGPAAVQRYQVSALAPNRLGPKHDRAARVLVVCLLGLLLLASPLLWAKTRKPRRVGKAQ